MQSTPLKQNADLVGTEEAAIILDVEPRTLEVWRCTKRYRIPYIKVGRLVKYRRADLTAWLESRMVDGEAA